MKKLIVITSFVLMPLLAGSAGATGPFKEKEQVIISPPLSGFWHECTFLNVSNEALEIQGASLANNEGLQVQVLQNIDALHSYGWGRGTAGVFPTNRSCVISWFGKAGDVKASFCAHSEDPARQIPGYGCITFD